MEEKMAAMQREMQRVQSTFEQQIRAKEKQIVELSKELRKLKITPSDIRPACSGEATASVDVSALLGSRSNDMSILQQQLTEGLNARDEARRRLIDVERALKASMQESREKSIEIAAMRDELCRIKQVRDAGSEKPDSSMLEVLLRSKEKHLVSLTTDNLRLNVELEALQSRVKVAEDSATEEKRSSGQLANRLTETQRRLDLIETTLITSTAEAQRGKEVTRLNEELTKRLDACEKRAVALTTFREQHEHCARNLRDQEICILSLKQEIATLEKSQQASNTDKRECVRQLQVSNEERNAKERAVADLNEKLATERRKTETLESQLRRLTSERQEEVVQDRTVLDNLMSERKRLLEDLSAEKDAHRRASKQLSDKLRAITESEKAAQDRLSDLLRTSETSDGKLRQELASVVRERNNLKAAADQHATEQAERKTSLQKMSLEVEELKQRCSRFQKQVFAKDAKIQELSNRLAELEGSYLDTATSSRKITGILESMNQELAASVAEHLRLDFMRDGFRTRTVFSGVFNLDEDTAREVTYILCMLYLAVFARMNPARMCKLLGVKEITVRRIVSVFSQVAEKFAPTERRTLLKARTPPASRKSFMGHERLQFLCCASRGQSLRPIACDSHILALICTYLPPLIRGYTCFASHRLSEGGDGSTVFLAFKGDASFEMVEAQVTSTEAVAVRLAGRASFSPSTSQSSVKVELTVQWKREAFADNTALSWGPVEELAAADAASSMGFTIRWDNRHDGLVADGATKLREVSFAEHMSLEELYRESIELAAMRNHVSWNILRNV